MARRLLALAAGGALLLTACGGSPITSVRLNASIGPTFTHLYAAQQQLLGNPADPAAYTTASCARPGGATAGAGDDWLCSVVIYRRTGLPVGASIEVRVKTNGCYVANPPFAVVGQVRLQAAGGAEVDNPLSEFDGCFNTA